MRSKRLQVICKGIQEHNTDQCICQGTFEYHGKLIDPCDVPCNPVIESFSEVMRYQNE